MRHDALVPGNFYSPEGIQEAIAASLARMGVERLDAVFVTHTDNDHTGGLDWLAASDIPVGAWYASAMYTGVKEKKHPVAQAAAARGQAVQWLRRGDAVPMGDSGATLEVLAPDSLFEDKDDNNSLVMMLESPAGRMLLAGDMELPEEAELLSQGDDLGCAVLKVANHGDDDTTSAAFAKAASAQLAVISTDSQEKPDTPDPGVVSRLQAAGSQVIVTEDSGLGLAVTLSGGMTFHVEQYGESVRVLLNCGLLYEGNPGFIAARAGFCSRQCECSWRSFSVTGLS